MMIILLIVNILMVIITSLQSYNIFLKLLNFSINSNQKINRKFDSSESEDSELSKEIYFVPGDCFEITDGAIIPCDMLLIQGKYILLPYNNFNILYLSTLIYIFTLGCCSINESEITGENNQVMKYPLPKNTEVFNYKKSQNSIIYQGSKVYTCENEINSGTVMAIVINSGFNTSRGNQIQNLLFVRQTNFNFIKEISSYLLSVFILSILGVIFLIYNYFRLIDIKTKKEFIIFGINIDTTNIRNNLITLKHL